MKNCTLSICYKYTKNQQVYRDWNNVNQLHEADFTEHYTQWQNIHSSQEYTFFTKIDKIWNKNKTKIKCKNF